MNLNWKDLLIIGLFLIGAIAITFSYKGKTKTEPQPQVLQDSSLTQPIAANVGSENPNSENTHPETQNQTNKTEIAQAAMPTVTPEGISVDAGRKVESPISNTTTKTPPKAQETVAKTTEKSVETPKTAKPSKAAEIVKTEAAKPKPVTPAPVQRSIPPTVVEKPQTVAPFPNGTFYLIAASRATFEDAQKSFDLYKNLGYNPIMLSPIKSKGIDNYRVAIYRNTDRKTVDDYNAQINGKAQGFWVDQR